MAGPSHRAGVIAYIGPPGPVDRHVLVAPGLPAALGIDPINGPPVQVASPGGPGPIGPGPLPGRGGQAGANGRGPRPALFAGGPCQSHGRLTHFPGQRWIMNRSLLVVLAPLAFLYVVGPASGATSA